MKHLRRVLVLVITFALGGVVGESLAPKPVNKPAPSQCENLLTDTQIQLQTCQYAFGQSVSVVNTLTNQLWHWPLDRIYEMRGQPEPPVIMFDAPRSCTP